MHYANLTCKCIYPPKFSSWNITYSSQFHHGALIPLIHLILWKICIKLQHFYENVIAYLYISTSTKQLSSVLHFKA